MSKKTIGDTTYTIEYKETKIGDSVLDKNTNNIYEATIADADDLNWIVISKEPKKIRAKKEALSMYGVPMSQTCHKGYECGISGLSCQSNSCPHT